MNDIDARAQYLAGVRELITWLEQNPTQPLPVSREFNVPVSTNSAVEEWAANNDMADDAVQYDKEGNASISLRFGPVTLHVYGYVNFAEHCDRTDGRNAREYAEKHGLVLVEVASADDATEAFVDAADAERYAQRDDYVNSADAEAASEAAQEAWAEQREAAVDEALDAREEFGGLGSTWADPVVLCAVRETIAESGS